MTTKNKKYVDNPFQSPAVLSFCPGFLGLERGLERAVGAINVVAYVEIEAFIIENIIKGMEAGILDAAPVWTDVKTFDPKNFRNKIHIITGGYPCQPFSLAGDRKGTDDPRHLWPFIFQSVKAIEPVCCFFENVSGHLSMGYEEVCRDLRNIGYSVEEGLFTAEEVGAPHERERLFILAIRKDYLSNTNSNNGGSKKRRMVTQQKQRRHLQEMERVIREWQIKKYQRKMADNESRQSWQQETRNWGQGISGRSEEEMANTNGNGNQAGYNFGGTEKDTNSIETKDGKWQRGGVEFKPGGEKMENSDCSRQPEQRNGTEQDEKGNNRITEPGSEISNPISTNVQGGRPWSEQTGQPQSSIFYEKEKVSDTVCEYGYEIPVKQWQPGIGWQLVGHGYYGPADEFPAAPGQPQYDWEEPRTQRSRIALPAAIHKMGKRLWKNYKKILSKEDRHFIEKKKYATIESGMGSTINGYNFREDLLRAYGNKVVEQTAEIAFIVLLEKHKKNIELSLVK